MTLYGMLVGEHIALKTMGQRKSVEERAKAPAKRLMMIKATAHQTRGYINLPQQVFFPEEYIGKTIMLRVEIINDETSKPICGMPKFERNHSDNIKDTYFCHLTADDIEEMYEQVQKGVGKFLIRIREMKE